MTLITFQDGKVVFRDGKVGTEQACCCEQGCCGLDASATQPSVVVSGSDCVCENGSHNGTYSYQGNFYFNSNQSRTWFWTGQTSCETEIFGSPFFSDISISVTCTSGEDWTVSVATYALPAGTIHAINGQIVTCGLSINASGDIAGSVEIELVGDFDFDGTNEYSCTMTLTFG